jgi:predicted nucleic acid-binding protein
VTVFFDTNILLYADDLDAGDKTTRARDLLRSHFTARSGAVSTQVLQEYFVNARTKLGMDGAAARMRVEIYCHFHLVTVDSALILHAIDLHRLESLSFWDAVIVRAAQRMGCSVLYSEDLQNGHVYDKLRVVDPFK